MALAVANMLERLRANGLFQGSIQYHLHPNSTTEEMGIDFEIDPDHWLASMESSCKANSCDPWKASSTRRAGAGVLDL